MAKISRRTRFAPGAGMPPPVLAGREREKALIGVALQAVEDGANPPANIALIGPRGNGKTVLLRWAEAKVGRKRGKLDCAVLNLENFETLPDIVRAIANQHTLSKLAGDGFSLSADFLGSGIGVSRQEAARELLRPVLDKRCAERGLVILVDEAHTLDRRPDVSRAFFNAVQSVAGGGRPLLLVLAGTPDMPSRLNRIEAAFWSRLERVGIGLLDTAASRLALKMPLEQMGYGIQAGALDRAVEAAQCYPYFLQLVGQELHRAATAEPGKLNPGGEIGDAILAMALRNSQAARETYCADRYRELRVRGLLPAAEAVAGTFESRKAKAITAAAFENAVSRSVDAMLENKAKESNASDPALWAEDELRNLGFVWSQVGGERYCEPGIPSLMDYVVELARERRNEQERETRPSDSAPLRE